MEKYSYEELVSSFNEEEFVNGLLKDQDIRKLISEGKITEKDVSDDPWVFDSWLETRKACQNCPGLSFCAFEPQGYRKELEFNRGRCFLAVGTCEYYRDRNRTYAHKGRYVHFDMPEKYMLLDIDRIDLTNEREDYIGVYETCRYMIDHPIDKGLYIYGDIGTGKTYLSICMLNSFARKGKSVAFVHVPDLIMNLQGNITNSDYVANKIDQLKKADYLVMDDIGAEKLSLWSRDEVILPILNDRMENRKITFFTSNSDMDQLKSRMTYVNGQKDTVAGERIMERIRVLAEPIPLKGNSRRN